MQVKTIYLPEVGYICVKELNGKQVPIYPLKDEKLAKQYSGYRLILKDLLIVKDALLALIPLLLNGERSIIKQSLSFYAVINYSKCFVTSEGRGTRLNEETALEYASEEEKKEHKRIIHQRHSYVAHCGLEGYEQNPVVLGLNPEGEKSVIDIYDNMIGLADIDSQLAVFLSLVDAVIKHTKEKCGNKLNALKEKIKALDINDVYEKSITPSETDLISVKNLNTEK